jgi:exodeoxyribonuclease VII small subunit
VGVTKGQPKDGGPATDGGAGPAARPAYEQARDELTELVKRLEAGGLTLEQSLDLWERGEKLAAICEEWLEGARARLARAMAQRGDGQPAERPADADGAEQAPF